MAKFGVQDLISREALECAPEVRDGVKINMLNSLMQAVQAQAMFGEVIVNIQPIHEEPASMGLVRFEQDVQISPLVRCRECRFHYNTDGGWFCSRGVFVNDAVPPEDFFCGNAKRKDGAMK